MNKSGKGSGGEGKEVERKEKKGGMDRWMDGTIEIGPEDAF